MKKIPLLSNSEILPFALMLLCNHNGPLRALATLVKTEYAQLEIYK